MVGLIFGIIVLVAGIVIGVVFNTYSKEVNTEYKTNRWGDKETDENGNYIKIKEGFIGKPFKKFAKWVIIAGIFLCALLTFFGCITNVGTGKTGVVTTFGKLENYTLDSGFHLKAPWNKVTEIDTTINELHFSTPAYTSDSQTVDLEISIQYRISTTDTFNVVKDNGIDKPQDHLQDKLQNRITSTIKTIVSTRNANDLLVNRSTLVVELSQKIDEFKSDYYIILSSTNITNIDFTDEYEAAVAMKVAQQQAYEKALIEQQQALAQAENEKKIAETNAEAEALKAKIAAQAEAEVVKIQAEAAEYQGKKESSIVLNRLAGINGWTVIYDETTQIYKLVKADGTDVSEAERSEGVKRLIEYYYTQVWDGKLPDTYVGDGSVSSIIISGD